MTRVDRRRRERRAQMAVRAGDDNLARAALARRSEHGIDFRVLTYHEAELEGSGVRIHQLNRDGERTGTVAAEFQPATIINATGAWGDLTLKTLGIPANRLFGGTKGSHIITRHTGLRSAIGDDGIYAETSDGRLVFILPFGDGTLVGTTDLRFEGSPGKVIATEEEIVYLLEMVNSVIEDIDLQRTDVVAHYCGVRPLPYVPSGKTGSIPRGHSCHTSAWNGIPLHTLIGGKLTTWRAFGEEMADRILKDLQQPRITQTGERPIPGAYALDFDVSGWIESTAQETGHPVDAVRSLFGLMGTAAADFLEDSGEAAETVPTLPLTTSTVQQIIQREWVTRLTDLVERRLALVFTGNPSVATLRALADCLVEGGKLAPDVRDAEVESCAAELHRNYGLTVNNGESD